MSKYLLWDEDNQRSWILIPDTNLRFVEGPGGTLSIQVINPGGGGSGSGSSSDKYAKLSDTKASGTQGGTFTSGAWRTRVLNTIDNDSASIVSLSSNQFTLQAGTYRIHARAPAFFTDQNKTRLQNITDGTTTILGTSEYSPATSPGYTIPSFVFGEFAIASQKTFEFQHHCDATAANIGFGVPTSIASVSEVYAIVELWKKQD